MSFIHGKLSSEVIQHICGSLNLHFPMVLVSNVAHINTQMPGLINQNHLLNYLLL